MRNIAIISSQAFSLVNFRGPLIRDLVRAGASVYALAPDFDDETRARTAALGAKPVEYSLSRAGMNPLRDGADVMRLRGVLRRLKVDLSLAYFIKPVIYGSIAAWSAGIPRRFSMIEGLGYVFTDTHQAGQPLHRRLLRATVSRIYRRALRLNEKVFFLNDDDAAQFTRGGLVKTHQVARIDGIGVDLEHYTLAPPVVEPMTFLLLGRMLKEKGVHEFVRAAQKLRREFPQLRFVLVGASDANPGSIPESQLRTWADAGWVEWAGQVDDVRSWMARASVFVLPSYREGLPRSSQEAMAMGRPVITTNAVGCRDTVADGINGWQVPVGDVEALAAAMRRFVNDPSLVASMGAQSRKIAEQRFDVHQINRKIISVLGFSHG